jgi:hypothetical protein
MTAGHLSDTVFLVIHAEPAPVMKDSLLRKYQDLEVARVKSG